MKTKYLDTNCILRLIIKDDLEQLAYVKNLLLRSNQKECKLFSSVVVIFECEWVLRSFYKFSKNDIVKIMHKILILQEIEFENSDILYSAFENMLTNNLGLEDNYHLAYCQQKNMKLETFDQKLKNKAR